MITWKQSGKTKVPEPKIGFDTEFDEANEDVSKIKTLIN